MTIVLVIDMYDANKNGTTMSARRLSEYLRKKGHEEGRENIKEVKKAVLISNHIHNLDCTMIGIAAFPRRTTLVS